MNGSPSVAKRVSSVRRAWSLIVIVLFAVSISSSASLAVSNGPGTVVPLAISASSSMQVATSNGPRSEDVDFRSTINIGTDRVCDMPDGADIGRLPPKVFGPHEAHPDLEWLVHPVMQQALENVQAILDASPTVFVGSYIDFAGQSLNVLYSPVIDDIAKYEADIRRAAEAAPADLAAFYEKIRKVDRNQLDEAERAVFESDPLPSLPAEPSHLEVWLRPACRAHDSVAEALSKIMARDWHPDAKSVPMLVSLDIFSVSVKVTLAEGLGITEDLAVALATRFGDSVVIVRDRVPSRAVGGRSADVSPHMGGARIKHSTVGNCSSGFAMIKSGGRFMLTAGHCATGNAQQITNGTGGHYGISNSRTISPTDAMLIASAVEQYRRSLYVDPCCPTERLVTSKGTNFVGQSLCASGATTKARCSGVVEALTDEYCDALGCSENLRRAVRPSSQVYFQPGDSGGPMYVQLSTSNASVRGMGVVGYTNAPFDTAWFHGMSHVESAVGAVVATICCDGPSY